MGKWGKLLTTTLLCICVLSFLGCTLSKEEQQKKKDVTAKAKTLANTYIKEKYNIKNAKIKEVSVDTRIGNLFPEQFYTDEATVLYSYNKDEFHVFVNTSENIIFDDYQVEDIKQGFLQYVYSQIPYQLYSIPEDYKINFTDPNSVSYGATAGFSAFGKERYDGNIEKYLPNITSCDMTLLIEGTKNNNDIMLDKLNTELDNILRELGNERFNVKLAIYDASIISTEDIEQFAKDYSRGAMRGLLYEVSKQEFTDRQKNDIIDYPMHYSIESIIPLDKITNDNFITKTYDCVNYMEIDEYDFIEVSKCTVNSRNINTKRLGLHPYEKNNVRDENKENILSDFYSYGNTYGDDSFLYPEFIWVRINVDKLFPKEATSGKVFFVKSAKSIISANGKLDDVETLKKGGFLYFKMKRSTDYGIGVK